MTTAGSRTPGAISAWLAIPALALAVFFVALFFAGYGGLYGWLNDLFVAVTAALLILPARSLLHLVRVTTGGWFDVVTWVGIAGMAVIVVCQLLLVGGVVSLNVSFVLGGVGILPVLVWGVAQAYLGLRYRLPSRGVGWTMSTVLLSGALIGVASAAGLALATWFFTALLAVALVAYLALLARAI